MNDGIPHPPPLKKGIQEAHGRIAQGYGGYGSGGVPRGIPILRELISGILGRHGAKPDTDAFLDIGCGNGAFLELYHSLGFKNIMGVDLAGPMLRVAAARGGAKPWDLIQGDAEDLPLRKGAFDLINMFGVIQHLGNPIRAMVELGRVLRPGGLAIVDLPRRGSISQFSCMAMGVPTTDWGRPRLREVLDFRGKVNSYRFFTLEQFRGFLQGLPIRELEAVPTVYVSLHGPLGRLYDEGLMGFRRRHGSVVEGAARRLVRIPSGNLMVLRRLGDEG